MKPFQPRSVRGFHCTNLYTITVPTIHERGFCEYLNGSRAGPRLQRSSFFSIMRSLSAGGIFPKVCPTLKKSGLNRSARHRERRMDVDKKGEELFVQSRLTLARGG